MTSRIDDSKKSGAFKSAFITVLGRPNVGKSSLVNKICGEKIAITSNKPQTTRHKIRGVLHRSDAQLVFVDTPGIHKPQTKLGERLNTKAVSTLSEIDIVCFVVDATSPIGPGDKFIAEKLGPETIVLVNKCDKAKKTQIAERLIEASIFNFSEYFPVSAKSGEGLPVLIEHLFGLTQESPMFYPAEQVTDMSDRDYVAELVREQLLRIMQKRNSTLNSNESYRMGMASYQNRDTSRERKPEGHSNRPQRRKPKTSRNRSQKTTFGWSLHRTSSQC